MPRLFYSFPKPTYDITGKRIKRRKAFKTQTKKKEWMEAGGHNPDNWRTGFIKTSKCRHCGRVLHWGDRSYEFDHKDNNPANNSQKNCYLVCAICHRQATVIKTKRTKGIIGMYAGRKVIKKKVGYKKHKGRKKTRRKSSKKSKNPYDLGIRSMKIPKFKIPKLY